jgi:hypothetical protein
MESRNIINDKTKKEKKQILSLFPSTVSSDSIPLILLYATIHKSSFMNQSDLQSEKVGHISTKGDAMAWTELKVDIEHPGFVSSNSKQPLAHLY